MGYIDDNTPLTLPVGNIDIARYIGSNSGDIGTLCTSMSLINKWSFKKPIEPVGQKYELTDHDFYNANDGFVNLDVLSGLTLMEVKDIYSNGVDWEYNTPITIFRYTDFIGYDKNAKDLSPNGSIYEPEERESSVLNLTWDNQFLQHLDKLKIYSEKSTENKGFGMLGLFLCIKDVPFFVYIDELQNSPTGCTLYLDNLINAPHLANSQRVSGDLLAMPVLIDYGVGNDKLAGFSKDKLYTNEMLANRGVSEQTTQYAPYKLFALGGKPFTGVFTSITHRVWKNIHIMIAWTGGYAAGNASFQGQIYVRNDNAFDIDVSVFAIGNGGQSDGGSIKLYGDYDSTTYETLSKNDTIQADIKSKTWSPDEPYASVRIGIKTRIMVKGEYIYEDADFDWIKTTTNEKVKSGSFLDFIEGNVNLS